MNLVLIENLRKEYISGGEAFPALKGVSLDIKQGEFVSIMGESGSGKSTLLTILGGLNHPSSGNINVFDIDIYSLSAEKLADFRSEFLGFVFQSFNLIDYLTALENVMLPLAIKKMSNADKTKKALDVLAKVGLLDKGGRLPNELSGGEQERVAIARAIVNNPPLILADEPTGNLDSKTADEVMLLFSELNASGQTIVMVTHNTANALRTHRVINLKDGLVI